MITFKNITFDTHWIEADIEIHMENKSEIFHVKINRDKSKDQIIYEYNCTDKLHLYSACWNLLREVESNKIRQHSDKCMAWG